MKHVLWIFLTISLALGVTMIGCGPKDVEEVPDEATEETVEETPDEVIEEATETVEEVDIEAMASEIKVVVEEVNEYMTTHNSNNTDKAEIGKSYSGFGKDFDDIKTNYVEVVPSDEQKEEFDKHIGIISTATTAMENYSKGATASGMDGMSISMEGASLWQEVNDFFGIKLM